LSGRGRQARLHQFCLALAWDPHGARPRGAAIRAAYEHGAEAARHAVQAARHITPGVAHKARPRPARARARLCAVCLVALGRARA